MSERRQRDPQVDVVLRIQLMKLATGIARCSRRIPPGIASDLACPHEQEPFGQPLAPGLRPGADSLSHGMPTRRQNRYPIRQN